MSHIPTVQVVFTFLRSVKEVRLDENCHEEGCSVIAVAVDMTQWVVSVLRVGCGLDKMFSGLPL